jgi:hypothetical protein
VSKLFGYDLSVEYRPGKLNRAANALSRRAEEVAAVSAISASTFELFDKLWLESESDPQMTAIRAKLLAGEDLLLFRGKIFLPDASSMWPQLVSCT